jgi:NAD(P)-dependent dehydrogenase (short-subunit alcohol dehydrogenase family)
MSDFDIARPWAALEGTCAVVTGAAGGIGATVVRTLTAAGITVVAADLEETALEVVSGDRVRPVAADVATPDGMASIDSAVRAAGLPLALWMNNAGIVARGPLADVTVAEWDRVMTVNLRSVFLGCQSAHRLMSGQRSGSIVNVVSISSTRVQRFRAVYAASKAAVDNLTRNLAAEWGPQGIRVNAIAPGFVLTAMSNWHLLDDDGRAELLAGIPLGRMAQPQDVARMVLVLASPLSSYTSGETVHVDGGWSV